jgi:hypothetical protein
MMGTMDTMDTMERDQLIAKLISKGNSLSDIQKVLKEEHEIQITYMELRLISSDLEVNWEKVDLANPKPKSKIIDPNASLEGDANEGIGGKTVVTVSKVVRPGTVMSGDVSFKSGATAEWQLDQLGRLGLNPTGNSKKPTETDMQEFQLELQSQLQGKM